MARGLFLAVEEMREAESSTDKKSGLPPAANSLETTLLDVNEEGANLEQGSDMLVEASDDINTLDEVADTIEESAENGGMTPDAAKMAEVAVESIMRRQGMSLAYKPIASLESFGSTSSRMSATKLSLESVKEKSKELWSRFTKFISVLATKTSEYIKNVFNKLLPVYLERVAELVERVKTSEFEPREIPKKSFIKDLYLNNEFSPEVVKVATAKLGEYIGKLVDISSKTEGVIEAFNKVKANAEDAEAFAECEKAIAGILSSNNLPSGFSMKNGRAYSEELPGGRVMGYGIPTMGSEEERKENKSLKNHYAAFKGFFVELVNKNKFTPPDNINTLDKKEATVVIGNTFNALSSYAAQKTKIFSINNELSKLNKKVATFATASEGEDNKAVTVNIKELAKTMMAMVSSATTSFNKVIFSSSKAAMDYVEISIKE